MLQKAEKPLLKKINYLPYKWVVNVPIVKRKVSSYSRNIYP